MVKNIEDMELHDSHCGDFNTVRTMAKGEDAIE